VSDRRFVLTATLAALGVLVAVLAWRFPVLPESQDSSDQGDRLSGGGGTAQSATPGTADPAPSRQVRYLNTLTPEEGRRYIAPLPDDLRRSPEHAHTLAMTCPSNETGDKVRELTYPLHQRYLALAGTVTARFPPPASPTEPQVELASIANERQRDGTLRAIGSESRRATASRPSPITMDLQGAEKLILRISCELPGGVVILADARLTVVG
jgi:hypothetical protein